MLGIWGDFNTAEMKVLLENVFGEVDANRLVGRWRTRLEIDIAPVYALPEAKEIAALAALDPRVMGVVAFAPRPP